MRETGMDVSSNMAALGGGEAEARADYGSCKRREPYFLHDGGTVQYRERAGRIRGT